MQVSFLDVKRLHQVLAEPLEAAFKRVMNSGWFVLGPELEAFEEEFARYCCVEHCVGVGNWLEALQLLLRAYGIGLGDEVIVPSNTFITTWLTVTHCGATPVAVEPKASPANKCAILLVFLPVCCAAKRAHIPWVCAPFLRLAADQNPCAA